MIDEKLCNTYILFVSFFIAVLCLLWIKMTFGNESTEPPSPPQKKKKRKEQEQRKNRHEAAIFEQDLV